MSACLRPASSTSIGSFAKGRRRRGRRRRASPTARSPPMPPRNPEEGRAMEYYLPVIWSLLIAAAVGLYVVLDGFDLGVGILFPFARGERDRDTVMSSV